MSAPKHVIRRLERILQVSKFDDAACFGSLSYNDLTHPGTGEQIDVDSFVKEETRIYRETWLIPEIEEILAWAKGAS